MDRYSNIEKNVIMDENEFSFVSNRISSTLGLLPKRKEAGYGSGERGSRIGTERVDEEAV